MDLQPKDNAYQDHPSISSISKKSSDEQNLKRHVIVKPLRSSIYSESKNGLNSYPLFII